MLIKTMVSLPSGTGSRSRLDSLVFTLPKTIKLFGLQIVLSLIIPAEGYSRKRRVHKRNYESRPLVSDGIYSPVVSVSALTRFTRYIYVQKS